MWNVEELYVLSDLHLSAERDTGTFQSDAELAECLRWILIETRYSLLVLAGDALDLLAPDDGDAETDFNRPAEQMRKIIEYHPQVFEALSNLARSPRHGLIIMSGDRDPELIFPSVQEVVERRLGTDLVGPAVRWVVHGEALHLKVGDAVVLVEHGSTLDPCNRINHVALQLAFSLTSRNLPDISEYRPPLGGRLALEVGRELRSDYPWVDCLKPETEATLPLLWHVASPGQRKSLLNLADEYLSMKAFAHNKKNSHHPDKLYLGEKEAEDSPRERAFRGWVDAVYQQQSSTHATTDDHLTEKLRAVSGQGTLFEVEKSGGSDKYLQPMFECGADLIIHGHTRAAKAYMVGRGLYLNTGTWGQFLRLPRSGQGNEAWQDFLRLLRENRVKSFRRPTLARVRHLPAKRVTTAALLEWQQPGAQVLCERRFTGRQTGWHKEA
jgi:UDP-2,3-diacylglucosamine pyrophosphatase LpxH